MLPQAPVPRRLGAQGGVWAGDGETPTSATRRAAALRASMHPPRSPWQCTAARAGPVDGAEGGGRSASHQANSRPAWAQF